MILPDRTFTEQQLQDFAAYCKVQKAARYNMMSTFAVQATGLGHKRHLFVIEHYEALAQAAKVPA
jgi:hypothetical protein